MAEARPARPAGADGPDAPPAAALRALAAFAPRLAALAEAGAVRAAGPPGPGGVRRVPHVAYHPEVGDFLAMLEAHGWVAPFDWAAWAKSAEGRRLLSEPDAMETADAGQIRRVLTVCARRERFCEGALLAAFESGLMLRAARRAAALAAGGEAEGPRDG